MATFYEFTRKYCLFVRLINLLRASKNIFSVSVSLLNLRCLNKKQKTLTVDRQTISDRPLSLFIQLESSIFSLFDFLAPRPSNQKKYEVKS